MSLFTSDELNLICIYDPGYLKGLILELRGMMAMLMPDEEDLHQLTMSVLEKLEGMSDLEYQALNDMLLPDISSLVFADADDIDFDIGEVN